MDLQTLRAKLETTEEVLAAWLENVPRASTPRLELHLALDENHLAAFYARRHDWLQQFDPVHARDIHHPWLGCLALTRDGTLLLLVLEPWGSLPERPRRGVQVLLDRTGRLSERLRDWSPSQRVDFARLDRLAADVWLFLWEAAALRARDVAGYTRAVAAALDAYLTFVAAAKGMEVSHLAWEGELARAAGLDDVDVRALTLPQVADLVAQRMSTHGRELGEARGWRYPVALEKVVRQEIQERDDVPP